MGHNHTITALIEQLQTSRTEAAASLWALYIDQLVRLAERRLRSLPRRVLDGEDVALSAFAAFFRGVEDGRFRKLACREDLWQILTILVERKAIAALRRELSQKRGSGQVLGESELPLNIDVPRTIDEYLIPCAELAPDFALRTTEMLETLTDPVLIQIAFFKLEGFTNRETASQLGLAVRTIERKLQLICAKWEKRLNSDP